MTTLIVVQARMTSTRLPGKVLLPLAGQPMLTRLVERLRKVRSADGISVATTVNAADDPIVDLCGELGIDCYRGSEHDVLSRYAGCAARQGADTVVRITSDCPLMDPELVDNLIQAYRSLPVDYVSNMLPPTWPYGLAVEVFSNRALQEAHREARQDAEREHVTPFIYWQPERYALHNVACTPDLSQQRWTVDTPEDFELVRRIFETLFPREPDFRMADVLQLMELNPDWMSLNQHIAQKTARPKPSHSTEHNA